MTLVITRWRRCEWQSSPRQVQCRHEDCGDHMIGNVATANSICWICGAPATTGEHGTKRSDLRDVFGAVAQGNPLFLHNSQQRNRRVGSLDAKALKLPAKLCAHCNNTRTQPHDLAWEKLSAGLRTWTPALWPGTIVSSAQIARARCSKCIYIS